MAKDNAAVNDKTLPAPLAELEASHAAAVEDFNKKITAASRELAELEAKMRETKGRLGELQRGQIAESFAYDAARARLIAKETKAA